EDRTEVYREVTETEVVPAESPATGATMRFEVAPTNANATFDGKAQPKPTASRSSQRRPITIGIGVLGGLSVLVLSMVFLTIRGTEQTNPTPSVSPVSELPASEPPTMGPPASKPPAVSSA